MPILIYYSNLFILQNIYGMDKGQMPQIPSLPKGNLYEKPTDWGEKSGSHRKILYNQQVMIEKKSYSE